MNQQFTSTDLSGFAKATTENFSKIQKELSEVFEEANRHWAGHHVDKTALEWGRWWQYLTR
jgi:hypothetical protein